MPLQLIAGPALEPVTLAEAKTWLRVAHDDEDGLIADLIGAARQRVEDLTGRALITQVWRERLDAWPERRLSAFGQAVRLLKPPLISVDAVRLFRPDGAFEVWDPAEYEVETGADPGRLIARDPFNLPVPERRAGGIEIEFTAGYGATAEVVPAPAREAILRLVADGYGGVERAESARRGDTAPPEAVMALLAPFQSVRL